MTTKHTCNNGRGPNFGRKTAGCPRCDELLKGANPVEWRGGYSLKREKIRNADILAHRCTITKCGPVCTFGDW